MIADVGIECLCYFPIQSNRGASHTNTIRPTYSDDKYESSPNGSQMFVRLKMEDANGFDTLTIPFNQFQHMLRLVGVEVRVAKIFDRGAAVGFDH